MKELLRKSIPSGIWKAARSRKILSQHKKVATACESLIQDFYSSGETFRGIPKHDFGQAKVIWQYWAQGYDNVPDQVQECLDSVERFSAGYTLVRLCDKNLGEYLDIPDFVKSKRQLYSTAHFADLLRLLLLATYGGVWLDATVFLSAPLPDEYTHMDYFMYQRDSDEKDKNYWEGTYAYYFGWNAGFRVSVLNSFIFSKRGDKVITDLASLMLKWWKENDYLPDYFFFQILYDVLINGKLKEFKCPVVSDCLPHYLQQSINDPNFNLMSKEDILNNIPIHKLTYK